MPSGWMPQGMNLLPGFIDIHSDNIETVIQPQAPEHDRF